jgi:hypothetical protein
LSKKQLIFVGPKGLIFVALMCCQSEEPLVDEGMFFGQDK